MGLKQVRAHFRSTREVAIKAFATMLVVAASSNVVQARSPDAATVRSNHAVVVVSSLPLQGQEILGRIRQGGPFRYEKDGSVFGNRERQLPSEKRGYYREYTVSTPGVRHRGARRIVCGGLRPRVPEACYYTEDHYSSFRLIVE